MNFDLNIDNYTPKELIEMFELPENYGIQQIEEKEEKLKHFVLNNREISNKTKSETINFLLKVKNILIDNSTSTNPPIDQDFRKKIKKLYNFDFDLQDSKLEENTQDHMVLDRQKVPFLSSFPSEYFSGVINPLTKKLIRKVLNIDTRFRDNYYSSPSTNFNLNLPLKLNQVVHMQLSSLELPLTIYAISKQYGNNFFSITANGISNVISIPDGNYTFNGIQTIINTQLDLLGGDFQYINFIVNENGGNGSAQMMVGLDGNQTGTIDFELNFQADRYGNEDRNTPLPLKFGWLLGFRNGIYINNQNYLSEGVINLSGPRYIYLVVDDFNNNMNDVFVAAFNSSILNKNILARISLTGPVYTNFSKDNFNIVTLPREYFGPVNLNVLNIQLLDEYGRIIDLNNMDYSFTLNLTILYNL
jgi:hypothetical protein